jgi:hypothetical protein
LQKHATIHHDGRKACIEWSARDQKIKFDVQSLLRRNIPRQAIIPLQRLAMYFTTMTHSDSYHSLTELNS